MTDTMGIAREVLEGIVAVKGSGWPGVSADIIIAALADANLRIIDTTRARAVTVHRFDKDDPETWPKTEYAPSGKPWGLVLPKRVTSDIWGPECGKPYDPSWVELNVTAYYDPADLTGGA